LPNLIGFIRLALIPVFLVLAFGSEDGRYAPATLIAVVIAVTDYLDGLVARLTGQYSRLGALLDPLVDRMLIVSVSLVAWHFELLPRAALAVLLARELLMLLLSPIALSRGAEIKVNWAGRLSVWPIMAGLCLSLMFDSWVNAALVWVGTLGAVWATVLYIRDLWPVIRKVPVQDLNPK
jgi:cardiolipin synthase